MNDEDIKYPKETKILLKIIMDNLLKSKSLTFSEEFKHFSNIILECKKIKVKIEILGDKLEIKDILEMIQIQSQQIIKLSDEMLVSSIEFDDFKSGFKTWKSKKEIRDHIKKARDEAQDELQQYIEEQEQQEEKIK